MAEEVKHTPGPWVAEYVPDLRSTLIGTADRQTAFARMETHNGEPDKDTQDANASMLAAAPELAEAVSDLLILIEAICPEFTESTVCANARAAIAKATGAPQ